MLGIFKKKTELDKLKKKHSKLLAEAYKLSHVNRKESDAKYAEADKLASEIERMEKEN
jgi:hypothetical protein